MPLPLLLLLAGGGAVQIAGEQDQTDSGVCPLDGGRRLALLRLLVLPRLLVVLRLLVLVLRLLRLLRRCSHWGVEHRPLRLLPVLRYLRCNFAVQSCGEVRLLLRLRLLLLLLRSSPFLNITFLSFGLGCLPGGIFG